MSFKFSSKGLQDYVMDTQAEIEGVDVPLSGDISFKIRRAGGANKAFSKVFQRETKPYRRKLKNGTLDDATNDKIMHRVYAEAVVVGWSGVQDDKDKDIPFSKEACIAFFQAFPEAFGDIVAVANEYSVFAKEDDDEAAAELGK